MSVKAAMARQALLAAVEPASELLSPGPGTASDRLTALHNYNPEGGTPLVDGLPISYHHFCVDKSHRHLYRYQGSGALFNGDCGEDPPEGGRREMLAGGDLYDIVVNFVRPVGEDNVVLMDCSVTLQHPTLPKSRTVSRQVQVTMRHAIQ